MAKLQKLDQHVLVPVILLLANLILVLAVYMLHAWYIVRYAQNPLLLQACSFISFIDNASATAYAQNRLIWGLLFACLLLAQVVSLRVRKFSISFISIALSLTALLVLWW